MSRIERMDYAMDDADLWFRGVAAARSGRTNFYGTAGDDDLKGTTGGDNFHVEQNNRGDGGNDTIHAGAGDDKVFFGSTYTDEDKVFGGDGFDRVVLEGTFATNFQLGLDNFRGIELLKLGDFGFQDASYEITLQDGLGDLRISARLAEVALTLDASAFTSDSVKVVGGELSDNLVGGQGDDTFLGKSSADTLTGGLGSDTFRYISVFDSRGSNADTITDFGRGDKIVLDIINNNDLFHIGSTSNHAGDIVARYDSAINTTSVTIFIDSDDSPDMLINLIGDKSALSVIHI